MSISCDIALSLAILQVDYFGQSKRGDLVRVGLSVLPLCDDGTSVDDSGF
jgi:hypothetical protein